MGMADVGNAAKAGKRKREAAKPEVQQNWRPNLTTHDRMCRSCKCCSTCRSAGREGEKRRTRTRRVSYCPRCLPDGMMLGKKCGTGDILQDEVRTFLLSNTKKGKKRRRRAVPEASASTAGPVQSTGDCRKTHALVADAGKRSIVLGQIARFQIATISTCDGANIGRGSCV